MRRALVILVDTPESDIGQFAETVGGGATVIDVRQSGEYVAGHVPGAVLIPMGQPSDGTAELDRQAPVYLVCACGHRRTATAGVLRSVGFEAYSVAGGTRGWAGPGRPSRA